MKKTFLFGLLFCLAGGMVSAQSISDLSIPSYNSLFNKSFLDMSRLTVKQSFSMSYLASKDGSLMTNLYRNSMSYKLTDKLELSLDLAYRFTPTQLNSYKILSEGQSDQSLFLPSFGMRYQPSKNIMIEFQYNQVDPYYYGNNPWSRRF
jgi:hypothetical protein